MEMRGKKGQMTVFVIIAIVVVAIILVVLLYPRIRGAISPTAFTPQNYLKSCLDNDVKTLVSDLSSHGGYLNPEGFYLYNNEKIKYLCYTSEWYALCTVQEPMVITHFENELKINLDSKARLCFDKLKNDYESKGYSVSGTLKGLNVAVEPGKIKLTFDSPLTFTKDKTDSFDGFNIAMNSQMYNVLSVVQSIVEFEATYGDSETTNYIRYYPDLRVEKIKMDEGTKVYKVSNYLSKEEFVFASRSLSWPPGYGGLQ